MIELRAKGGEPIFINPDLVEAVEVVPSNLGNEPQAGVKLASGKEYIVEGTAAEIAKKLFPPTFTARPTNPLGR